MKPSSKEKFATLSEAVLETLREPILILNEDLKTVMSNRSFYQTFQVSKEETLNKFVFDLGNKQWDIPKLRSLLTEIVSERREFHDFEVAHVFDSLGLRIMVLNARKIVREPHAPNLILLAIEDITKRRQLEVKLQKASKKILELSLIDGLTHLYNRKGFLKLASQQIKLADRMMKQMSLFFIDLDNLKQINDRFGHHSGDRLLVTFGTILKNTFRKSDIISRFGGDEFVVIGFKAESVNTESVIARIDKKLTAYAAQKALPYKLSASVGIAYYNPAAPKSISALLSQADKMMYTNKQRLISLSNDPPKQKKP